VYAASGDSPSTSPCSWRWASRRRAPHSPLAVTGSLRRTVTAAAVARAVSVAAVAGGAWASGAAALERSWGAASLRDFDVIRDLSLDHSIRPAAVASNAVIVTPTAFPVLRLIRHVSTQIRTPWCRSPPLPVGAASIVAVRSSRPTRPVAVLPGGGHRALAPRRMPWPHTRTTLLDPGARWATRGHASESRRSLSRAVHIVRLRLDAATTIPRWPSGLRPQRSRRLRHEPDGPVSRPRRWMWWARWRPPQPVRGCASIDSPSRPRPFSQLHYSPMTPAQDQPKSQCQQGPRAASHTSALMGT